MKNMGLCLNILTLKSWYIPLMGWGLLVLRTVTNCLRIKATSYNLIINFVEWIKYLVKFKNTDMKTYTQNNFCSNIGFVFGPLRNITKLPLPPGPSPTSPAHLSLVLFDISFLTWLKLRNGFCQRVVWIVGKSSHIKGFVMLDLACNIYFMQ